MYKFYCNGKHGFCDHRSKCGGCPYADGSGGEEIWVPNTNKEKWCAKWLDFKGKPKCSECAAVFPEEYFEWPFCPKCGKAMNDMAWDVLKKRLEASENG